MTKTPLVQVRTWGNRKQFKITESLARTTQSAVGLARARQWMKKNQFISAKDELR